MKLGQLITVCWRSEDFVEVSKELRHWPGKLGIYELELCGTKEQFYILFSYLQVASVSVSTWGVTGSLLFARSISLAAQFWTVCNFERSFSGMPKRRALHESILEVTKAWINFSVVFVLIKCLICAILLRADIDELQTFLMCSLSCRCWSIWTPRFRAMGLVSCGPGTLVNFTPFVL